MDLIPSPAKQTEQRKKTKPLTIIFTSDKPLSGRRVAGYRGI
jgi:hypothetical protein